MAEDNQLLDSIERRLRERRYKVSRDIQLPGGALVDITASRTYFSWKGLVILSQHVIIKRIDNATVADMKELFDAGFRFGKKVNRVPLLRGLQFGYMILPVIVSREPKSELIEYVSASPRKHWSLFEFPVVIDLSTGNVSYFRKTAAWGAFFFSDMRSVVSKYIEGKS